MFISLCNFIGVFAFAFAGARKALDARRGFLLVTTCAFLTALGGGTVREAMLGHVPLYIHEPWALSVAGLGALFATMKQSESAPRFMWMFDAIGTAAFAVFGCGRAADASLGLDGCVLFALLTAVGGGMMVDVLLGRHVSLQSGKADKMLSVIVALLYWAFGAASASFGLSFALICAAVALRFAMNARRMRQAATTVLRRIAALSLDEV